VPVDKFREGMGTQWLRRNRPPSPSTPPFSWLPSCPGWQYQASKPIRRDFTNSDGRSWRSRLILQTETGGLGSTPKGRLKRPGFMRISLCVIGVLSDLEVSVL
jgi:hypothetical protein